MTSETPVVPFSQNDIVIPHKEVGSRPSWLARAGAKVGVGSGSHDGSGSHERDRFMIALLLILLSVQGVFYGLSPLVLPVSEVFAKNGSDSYTGGLFLYGFGVLFITLDFMALVIIDVVNHRPGLRKAIVSSALAMWPGSLAFLGLMVYVQSLLGFFVAFFVMAYPMAVLCMYMLHVEMPLWFGDDITKGSSFCGFATGVGAVFWTLFLGETTNAMGHENVAVVILIAAVVSGTPMLLVLFLCNPSDLEIPVQNKQSAKPGEIDVEKSVKSKGSWWKLLLSDRRAQMYCFIMVSFLFAGLSMKMLLSTVFEEALMLSYVDACRLAAVCLLMYLPGRGLAPLYCSKDRVFTIFWVILICEAAAYALTPLAISLGVDGSKELALGVYTTLRLMSGGGFAVLLGNIGVLAVRVFELDEIHDVMACFSATEWIAGVGPSVAWLIHVQAREESHTVEDEARSFNSFFYLCAGVAVFAAICVGLLQREDAKRGQE